MRRGREGEIDQMRKEEMEDWEEERDWGGEEEEKIVRGE
jgi:hypothetical protein